jgi:hypothetical protein
MIKNFSLLFLILFFVSCGDSGSSKNGSSDLSAYNSVSQESAALVGINDPLPIQAETFRTNVTLINFTPEQRVKYEKAIGIVKKVVASEEFKNRLLNFTYQGALTYVDTTKSNEEIYQNILKANERLFPAINNQMDVEIELYYENTTTVGYTYSNSKRIWVNTKYFNNYTPASVAGNLFHEWLHKLGYTHAVSYSISRDSSVPYAIGRMVSSLGRQYE